MKDRLTRFVKNFERKEDSSESPAKTKINNKDSNLLDEEEKFDEDMDDF